MQEEIEKEMPVCARPWYTSYIARHRDDFAGCALVFDEDEDHIYRFLYAKKNPVYATFIRARRAPRYMPSFETLAAHESNYDAWLDVYSFDLGMYVQDIDMPVGNDGNIYVLQKTLITSKATVEVRREPQLFEDFLRTLPPAPNLPTPSGKGGSGAWSRELLERLREEYPWLTEADLGTLLHGRRPADHERSTGRADKPVPKKKEIIDEEFAKEVQKELDAKRDKWISELPDTNFYVHIAGGGWTKEVKHVVADQAICLARAHVHEFCRAYKWPRQKGFSFNKFVDEHNANQLAQAWQERGHHFYEMWTAESGGSLEFQFSDEQLDSFAHPEEWLDWALSIFEHDVVWQSVQEVVYAKPTNPV